MNETEKVVASVNSPVIYGSDEEHIREQVTDIQLRAESFVIETDDDYREAAQIGVLLKEKASQVTSFFKPMKDNAYQAHKAICDREKAMLAPLKNAETVIKRAMGEYHDQKERERREREEAARRAAEKERERKLSEAESLERSGDAEGAAAAMQEAMVMDAAAQYTVPAEVRPKVAGVSTSRDWEIEEIDSEKVPVEVAGVEIRPVDKAAVMRLIRASKGQVKIPGVTYREVTKTSFRKGA